MMKLFIKSIFLVITTFFISNSVKAQSLFFERVYDETLAQASYVIGNTDTKEAIVIDAKRDIDTYLNIAKQNNLRITHVTETHIHADFLSGSRELATATGAKLYLSDEGGEDWQYEFAHESLKDGSKIQLGAVSLEIMHTPGHTPESITFLVKENNESSNVIKAITGDFIFVGDVGRPDLLEKAAKQIGTQEIGAKQLFASIKRFEKLPDNTEIWPGHGAGSFCGKSLSNIPQSTLAQEKASNKALQFKNYEAGFVKYILEGQPEPPMYFAEMKRLNKVDRPFLIEVPKISKLNKIELDKAIINKLLIIDTRSKEQVAQGFVPGSLHIEGGKSFATFVGSLIDYNLQIVLIAEENKIEDLTRKLMRIGMDNIYGYSSDVNNQSLKLQTSNVIDIKEFKSNLDKKDIQFVDVRTENEYKSGHIKGVKNIPLNQLEQNLNKIDKNKPVVIHCQSGVRAAMAYSILRKNGFENVINYSGGINDWKENKSELVK